MSIPYSTKINQRISGSSISSEPHIIGISGTATYTAGAIRLVEVPQAPAPSSTVSIPGYTEIFSGTPSGFQFIVNYTTGVITFATSQDGNSISVSYIGLGSEFGAEDVNEVQNPLNTIANQTISYAWPSAPTVSWGLANQIVKPANISTTPTDVFTFPSNIGIGGTTIQGTTNLVLTPGTDSTTAIEITNASNTPFVYFDSTNKRIGDGVIPVSTLDVSGSFGANIVTKAFVNSPYTATSSDYTILANAVSGAVVVTIPTASTSTRRIYVIKKIDSSANTVTLNRSGSDLIDGATSQVLITQYQSLTIQSDGTDWWVI